jgi:hypothetical protein
MTAGALVVAASLAGEFFSENSAPRAEYLAGSSDPTAALSTTAMPPKNNNNRWFALAGAAVFAYGAALRLGEDTRSA